LGLAICHMHDAGTPSRFKSFGQFNIVCGGKMALIDVKNKVIHCHIVYYGTAMSGRTTNLVYIHKNTRIESISSIDVVKHPYTIHFYCVHPETVRGYQIYFHVSTNPGVLINDKERKSIIKQADGVVIVIDSRRGKINENKLAIKEMKSAMKLYNKGIENFPIVMQYNKQDFSDALSFDELNKRFNLYNWSHVEAIATSGVGVLETYSIICEKIINKL
jgi:signal recognition particle receptor subunit beta